MSQPRTDTFEVSIYRVGQIKRGQCSFSRRSKACFREFWKFLAGESQFIYTLWEA